MCARPTCASRPTARSFDVVLRERGDRQAAHHRRRRAADARPAQRAECAGCRSRSRASSASPTTVLRKALAGFGGVKRRFTKTGEVGGITVDRRLRPPSGRDRAPCCARRARPATRQGHRGRAAAPLHAPPRPVRGVLHLLQRRRQGDRRRRLFGRRGADRGRRPRRAGRRAAQPRPPQRQAAAERRRPAAAHVTRSPAPATSSSASAPAASPQWAQCPARRAGAADPAGAAEGGAHDRRARAIPAI